MATELGKAYVQIIPSAKGISSAISSELGGGAGAAGTTAGLALVSKLKGVIAAAGIGKFLSDSISTGAEFDKSISQVAATMGLTTQEMAQQVGTVDLAWGEFSGNLREYAQEMGANTAFSASQSAEALNYMALAGYDVQTSMEMLPNVLNLAAAGSIDLAYASDMVTDTQTALGLSTERTAQLVDEMAKTASTTNTSVSQLGEAMLQIGATARDLSGGFIEMENGETLAYDSTQSLSMALGVLADNGIKGAEGGTHLRNMIMSLTSPTDQAAAAMETLGVDVYDADGTMRPFISILGDLNHSMDDLTDAEKTNIISTIFNKTDIASVNALLGTSEERWTEIGAAIVGAEGAAQAMADTQLDNLAGDVTLFQSALEGVKIALSDAVTPALREVVQLGSELMTAITSALTEGDMSGLANIGQTIIQAISDSLANAPQRYLMLLKVVEGMMESLQTALPGLLETGVSMIQGILDGITESLPMILDEGFSVISNLANGILESIPELVTAAGDIISQFVDFIMVNLPTIMDAGVKLLLNLVNGIIDNLPEIVKSVMEIITKIITTIVANLPSILQQGIEIVGKLASGLIKAIPKVIMAIPQIITSIVNAFAQFNWLKIGSDILEGIKRGILGAISSVVNAAKEAAESIWNAVKGFFDIGSPSKLMAYAGEMVDAGLAEGITDNQKIVNKAMDGMKENLSTELQMPSNFGELNTAQSSNNGNLTINMTINGSEGQDINALAEIIQDKINNAVKQRELVYA